MAAELSSMRKRKPGGIMSCLTSAACEWFLMFLLFVDAVFSYFLREFAEYCELQTPCQLCSRLDHVLGGKKPECSWSLVCSSHKKEISSLVFCSLHSELAGFPGMCGECDLLVGKLWEDVGRFSGSRTCSCCNKTWLAAMSDDRSLLEQKPVGLGGCKANVEPPMLHEMKRLRDKLAASVRHRTTELELSSTSEPEKQLPEDGGGIKDHLGMTVQGKDPPASLSDAMKGHALREHYLAESQPKDVTSLDCTPRPPDFGSPGASSESSSVSSDSVYIIPSACSTVRITKKSIYIEETCERGNISDSMNVEEAAAGTSSDASTCSSHCAEEDTKCTSPSSNSEVGLLPEDEDCNSQLLQLPFSSQRNEVAGESKVDVRALYEELEEERKAAEIAVDQAMVMITRLQEGKAEVEMAAAQYIRLMELQAEFDMDSLERDLLSQKERELQDLQNELDFYRSNFWDGSGLEDLRKETSVHKNEAATSDSESAKYWRANGGCDPMSSSVSESWDEKPCVSHTLNKLVKNLYKEYCSEKEQEKPNGLNLLPNDGSSAHYNELELDDRLKELETASDSIKYASNSLRNGEDGLPVEQDMAHQLQKLQ